jgi:hypothetical protein
VRLRHAFPKATEATGFVRRASRAGSADDRHGIIRTNGCGPSGMVATRVRSRRNCGMDTWDTSVIQWDKFVAYHARVVS